MPRSVQILANACRTACASTSKASLPRLFSTSASRCASSLNSLNSMTDEEEALRDAVRKFATETLTLEKVREMDEAEKMDPSVIKALFDQGLMGIEIPEEYGGAGASFTSAIIAIEELAKKDASVSVMCDVHNTLVQTIIKTYGTDAQKEAFLPKLSTEIIGSFCLSEPASGSDAFALQSRAKKEADGWLINGTKMWITNGAEAELFLVFANQDPSKGYKGITCFLVEKKHGVKIAKKEQKLGIKASSTALLNFDDVKIPAENVIGKEGQGYKIAIECLNEGRIGIAAQMLGIAKGAFEKSVPYCYDRKQFGKAVGDFQAMSHQFAQIYTEIEQARLLTYNAARLKEEGKPFMIEAAQAKWVASQVAKRASEKAIEWGGGLGFTRETGIEKYYRDAMIGSIYEGTSNIQLETIGKHIRKMYGP